MEYLDDSAYFNLKMRFIILKTKLLQTRIAKLGHFLIAFVLGRRIVSGSEGMIGLFLFLKLILASHRMAQSTKKFLRFLNKVEEDSHALNVELFGLDILNDYCTVIR